jgi:hypothetical protein
MIRWLTVTSVLPPAWAMVNLASVVWVAAAGHFA